MADKDIAASARQKHYNSSVISQDQQFSTSNMTSSSMARISLSNAMTESFSCATAIAVDSSCPALWDKLPADTQHFSFNDINIGVQHGSSMPNLVGTRLIDVGWRTPPNTMFKGADPPSSAHILADSGFIERATRYSCFSGGNLCDISNPLSLRESVYLQDIPGEGGLKNNNSNMAGSSNCVGLLGEYKGTPHKNEKAIDEPKLCGSDASNSNSLGGQDDSPKGVVSKKRKRLCQETEIDQGHRVSDMLVEAVKDHTKLKQKGKQIPISTSDKVEYVHVRAPRGQATNSHSLAERVRREKISERMKFLQDIVPGCSKVTGKAVMLDEIINYVQSLQRQIEFLSMKLATLNHRVDTNAERLILADDILQSRCTPSSLVFPPITSRGFPTLHQSQGIVQTGNQTLNSSWDVLRRSMNSSSTGMGGGYKEHSTATWEDELHNVVHMGSSSTAPPSSQDISGSLPPGPMKAAP